ncbi:hypothetical protein, partial [Escherichia coli]|uniref:hypothetical protein n=1 Tax=Escherichia coli TaxID=562 RepID=UPI00195D991E
AEIHTIQPGEVLFPAFFPSENGERGRNLLRGREALPAQPENPLPARSGRGRCTNGTEDERDV